MKHLVSTNDLLKKEINLIFDLAKGFKNEEINSAIDNRILSTFFYEPSTRTRLSFEAASHRLKMNVLSVSDANVSSTAKGETLKDTIKTLSELSDIIVLRHYSVGSAKEAAEVSKVPIINAGDGDGEHPTQALLDLYTILDKFDNLDNLNILFFGDLNHARTAKSLKNLLNRYTNNKINVLEFDPTFNKNKDDFYEKLSNSNIIYSVRHQKERWLDSDIALVDAFENKIKIGLDELKIIKKDAIIMHPLPRTEEIDPSIDRDGRVVFFEQVRNGLFIRMAVINYLLEYTYYYNEI